MNTLSYSTLKYLSTKKDKYENYISYFAIENIIDVNEIVKDIHENLKMPYWESKESNYILKVKARHLEEKQI